jgi:hypothetical protein
VPFSSESHSLVENFSKWYTFYGGLFLRFVEVRRSETELNSATKKRIRILPIEMIINRQSGTGDVQWGKKPNF